MLLTLSRVLLFTLLALAPIQTAVQAHEIVPSIVTLHISKDGKILLDLETNLEAQMAGIGPQHEDTDNAPQADDYTALRALEPEALRTEFLKIADMWVAGLGFRIDGEVPSVKLGEMIIPPVGDLGQARTSILELVTTAPPTAQNFTWAFPRARGSSVLRIQRPGEELEARFLRAGEPSGELSIRAPDQRNWVEKAWAYMVVGFTHILPKGLDHILFVLGLFFLSLAWRPLLLQVTAFTVAHTITLALGLYGVVTISPAIVEPLIALSIVYVAVENIFTRKLQVWRPVIVFLFGLLHGLGFAGILTEIGLPPADYVLGLVSFNVGVEFGQLTVILMAFFAVGWMSPKPWYRQRVAIPASMLIAAMGAFWFIERTVMS